jgi:hypothetical protein
LLSFRNVIASLDKAFWRSFLLFSKKAKALTNTKMLTKHSKLLLFLCHIITLFLWPQDYENFVSYICKAYEGTAVPKGCSSVSLNTTIQRGKAKPIHPDCYDTGMLAFAARITSAITSWMVASV